VTGADASRRTAAATSPPPAASAEAGKAPVRSEASVATPNAPTRDTAFSSLPEDARRRLLDIGPRWATDITGHRKMVLEAYTPVLAATPRENIEALREIPYGPHERHRLDVYRRPGLSGAPVVVFVHGGAFIRGDKDSNTEIYGNVTRYFARHGCVGVNIEYRLAPEAAYPGGADDVARAVAWVRENAAAHGGDPTRIILFGHSAGGAHAGAYVCDPAVRPAAGHGLTGLILVSARLRADTLPGNPNAKAVRAYYGDDAALYEERSVTTHAENLDIPVFLAAGEFENTYLDAYTAEFAWRVGMARGRMPRFMHLRGHNHTSIVAHLDSGEESLGPALLDFVRAPG
jgi:acetyl esterase/lipase